MHIGTELINVINIWPGFLLSAFIYMYLHLSYAGPARLPRRRLLAVLLQEVRQSGDLLWAGLGQTPERL